MPGSLDVVVNKIALEKSICAHVDFHVRTHDHVGSFVFNKSSESQV